MSVDLLAQDEWQRQQALDVTQSYIVQAPAGSGKTELLIQRYLALLALVKKPQEIISITFTKKAANEMRTRIINALLFAKASPPPERAHAKKTWQLAKKALSRDEELGWNLLSNPNQLSIQTIDSFCHYLTQQLPLHAKLGAEPDLITQPQNLYQEAVQTVLNHLEENVTWAPAIADLLLHVDNDLNKLQTLLVSLLGKRDQWLSYLHREEDARTIKKILEAHLASVIEDHLQTLAKHFPKAELQELLDIACYAASQIEDRNSPLRMFDDPSLFPHSEVHDKKTWQTLASLLLTKNFSWRKRLDKEIGFLPINTLKNDEEKKTQQIYRLRLTELITTLSAKENLHSLLTELFFLPPPAFNEQQWHILQSLLKILKIVVGELRVTFKQYGKIDFIENAQAALLALGDAENPTDIALSLDYQIQHILVDEFQDTSITQYRLLEKLLQGWEPEDGRTLFLVGDPMQSIYRFREAEVGLFIRAKERGIANLKPLPLTLAVNFRAKLPLIKWHNFHFKKIFPRFNDIASGAVSYTESISSNQSADSPTAIQVRGFENDKTQAAEIVTVVQEKMVKDPTQKIAILVRSRTHLVAITTALKKAKINFAAHEIDSLAERPLIQDLLSLTAALLHPADRIAWLAILRAPWCGLSLADLLLIAGDHPKALIFLQLQNETIQAKLSLEGKKRLQKLLLVLQEKLATRERGSLRKRVEETWLHLGGPATISEETDLQDAATYFDFLEHFSEENHFFDLHKFKQALTQLFASTQPEDVALQIMTIHAAKGLEFDTVILPHLERKIPWDDKTIFGWMEQPLYNNKNGLLLAAIHATGSQEKDAIYEYIYRQQKIKLDYEIDRLLYVATTRAKESLCLFFTAKLTEKNAVKLEAGSFLAKLWPFWQTNQADLLAFNKAQDEDKTILSSRYLKRLPLSWQNPLPFHLSPVSAHQKKPGFLLHQIRAQHIGIIVHRLLQQIAVKGSEWWECKTDDQHRQYVLTQWQQLGMAKSDEAAIAQILLAINNTLADDFGRFILTAHPHAQSEFALSCVINGEIKNLIIDRTFVDNNNLRWIIDYKTSTFTQSDLAHFLKNEEDKYRLQLKSYQLAMKAWDQRPSKICLYFPLLQVRKDLVSS